MSRSRFVFLLLVFFFSSGLFAQSTVKGKFDLPGYGISAVYKQYRIWEKKLPEDTVIRSCFLEDTAAQRSVELPCGYYYVVHYGFSNGFVICYGLYGSWVHDLNGKLLVKSGYGAFEFLPGDSLLIGMNGNMNAWGLYSWKGTLLASGEGNFPKRTPKKIADSLLLVPAWNGHFGLLTLKGEWLVIPLFISISPTKEPGRFNAQLTDQRTGILDAYTGIFTEANNIQTSVAADRAYWGMNQPCKMYHAGIANPCATSEIVIDDLYGDYRIIHNYRSPYLFRLVNTAAKDTLLLMADTAARHVVTWYFEYPLLRRTIFNIDNPVFYYSVFSLDGKNIFNSAHPISVLPDDSTFCTCAGDDCELFDWNGKLLLQTTQFNVSGQKCFYLKYIGEERYVIWMLLDTLPGNRAYYGIIDKHGRIIVPAIIESCSDAFVNGRLNARTLDGKYNMVDTAGNFYTYGDSLAHIYTLDSLLANKEYTQIRFWSAQGSAPGVVINPYCYDRRTFSEKRGWTITSWYSHGKLVARIKEKTAYHSRPFSAQSHLRVKRKIMIRNGGRRKHKHSVYRVRVWPD